MKGKKMGRREEIKGMKKVCLPLEDELKFEKIEDRFTENFKILLSRDQNLQKKFLEIKDSKELFTMMEKMIKINSILVIFGKFILKLGIIVFAVGLITFCISPENNFWDAILIVIMFLGIVWGFIGLLFFAITEVERNFVKAASELKLLFGDDYIPEEKIRIGEEIVCQNKNSFFK